eukprot:Anaeramoba_ignava/a613494_48.p1 GENE.a613494_48~~a613494_48.p1  ORF type:complete len:278 (+),score=124.52 a613494_48:48-881(+)
MENNIEIEKKDLEPQLKLREVKNIRKEIFSLEENSPEKIYHEKIEKLYNKILDCLQEPQIKITGKFLLKITNELEFLKDVMEKFYPRNYRLQEVYNQRGVLYAECGDIPNAIKTLEKSQEIYLENKKNSSENQEPKYLQHVENVYNLSLFYFAQVYQKIGQKEIASFYLAKTLERQIENWKFFNVDPLKWAENATNLYQFYLFNHQWKSAEAVLLATKYVLEISNEKGIESDSNLDQKKKEEEEIYFFSFFNFFINFFLHLKNQYKIRNKREKQKKK